MSKVSFTVSIPHEGPHIPQLSVSCNNATYLSFKGTEISNARWGNGNTVSKKGWRRLEFGITGSGAATRLSLMVNTSVILPPLAWSTPGPAPAASTARGGSTATKQDLKAEKRRLKERAENENPRLQIENGYQSWNNRGKSRTATSRPERGERVRRSERKRHTHRHVEGREEDDPPKETFMPGEEACDRPEPEEYRREHKRKSYLEQEHERTGHRYNEENISRDTQTRRDHDPRYYYDRIQGTTNGEADTDSTTQSRRSYSLTGTSDKKVAGKKIAAKYGNQKRNYHQRERKIYHDDEFIVVEELGNRRTSDKKERYGDTREETGVRSRRSRDTRRSSARPVDFLYDPVVVDDC